MLLLEAERVEEASQRPRVVVSAPSSAVPLSLAVPLSAGHFANLRCEATVRRVKRLSSGQETIPRRLPLLVNRQATTNTERRTAPHKTTQHNTTRQHATQQNAEHAAQGRS